MKIRIETRERRFTVPVPTNLIFSDFTAWLAQTAGVHYSGEALKNVPPQAMKKLFSEFRRIKKKYGAWELVDVQSGDGARVRITL